MASAKDRAAAMAAIFGENDEEATVKHFLDTGYPPLNVALSSRRDGGLPVGRIVEIFGPPSSGKTAISTAAMISAQRMGGFAAFHDHEHSFSTLLAKKMGLDTSPAFFAYKKPRHFEGSMALCIKSAKAIREQKIIDADAPMVWVFDSLASMIPMSKSIDKDGKEREVDTFSMHDNTALARATSAVMPAFAQFCEDYGICAMFLNQMRTKPGVTYGDPTTTPGGDAPKFYASQRIQLGASRIQKGTGADAETIGSEITARVVKNKVSRPFTKAKWRFVFQPDGTGKFDVTRSMIEFLLGEKLLEKQGNYIVWKGSKYYPDALSKLIDERGEQGELLALMPKDYEPPVVAAAELDEAAA